MEKHFNVVSNEIPTLSTAMEDRLDIDPRDSVKITLPEIFDFADIPDAQTAMENEHTQGKIGVRVE